MKLYGVTDTNVNGVEQISMGKIKEYEYFPDGTFHEVEPKNNDTGFLLFVVALNTFNVLLLTILHILFVASA